MAKIIKATYNIPLGSLPFSHHILKPLTDEILYAQIDSDIYGIIYMDMLFSVIN